MESEINFLMFVGPWICTFTSHTENTTFAQETVVLYCLNDGKYESLWKSTTQNAIMMFEVGTMFNDFEDAV